MIYQLGVGIVHGIVILPLLIVTSCRIWLRVFRRSLVLQSASLRIVKAGIKFLGPMMAVLMLVRMRSFGGFHLHRALILILTTMLKLEAGINHLRKHSILKLFARLVSIKITVNDS